MLSRFISSPVSKRNLQAILQMMLLLLLFGFESEFSNAFQIPSQVPPSRIPSKILPSKEAPHSQIQIPTTTASSIHRTSNTQLQASLSTVAASSIGSALGSALSTIANIVLPSSLHPISKALRLTALFMATTMATTLCLSTKLRHQIFWQKLTYPQATPTNQDPQLLPGSLGCPFLGTPQIYLSHDPSYGAGNYYRKAAHKIAQKLGQWPRIWKYYAFGSPFAVLSGGKTFQKVLNMEFSGSLTSAGVDLMDGGLLPTESLLFEQSKKRHSYLRKLVGMALTPGAVAQTAPTLQAASEFQMDKILQQSANNEDEPTKFHQVCTDYTLDVAWRQILGLELSEEEIPIFEEKVATWIKGIMSIKVLLRIGVEDSPGYHARDYVISKIKERIDVLRRDGPDHKSTLSGMVYAVDEDDPTKRLTDEEIVANALILIFAGSETSASTLTNAMLFLGLHPNVWNNLVDEQERLKQQFGDELTSSTLSEANAPYLDAFLKETMRMRTVISGIPRQVLNDIDVDGDGKTIIPKGYLVDPSMLLTHEEDPNVKLPDGMHLDAIQGFRPDRWLSKQPKDDTENNDDEITNEKPNSDWYVPYGFGPRYCLGKNLAQLEMKIFLATVARKLDFPKLEMLPENYDYSSDKKDPSDPNYFSVQWAKGGSVIPMAGDGVLARVKASPKASSSNNQRQTEESSSFPVYNVTTVPMGGASNSTQIMETTSAQ